jgi:hypothetical protein
MVKIQNSVGYGSNQDSSDEDSYYYRSTNPKTKLKIKIKQCPYNNQQKIKTV